MGQTCIKTFTLFEWDLVVGKYTIPLFAQHMLHLKFDLYPNLAFWRPYKNI